MRIPLMLLTAIGIAVGINHIDFPDLTAAWAFIQNFGLNDPWLLFQRTLVSILAAGGMIGIARTNAFHKRLVTADMDGAAKTVRENSTIMGYITGGLSTAAGLITMFNI